MIEQTIREKLPEGFQTAEYLVEHGMVDMVVHRHELPKTLARILRMLAKEPAKPEEFLALPDESEEAVSAETAADETVLTDGDQATAEVSENAGEDAKA